MADGDVVPHCEEKRKQNAPSLYLANNCSHNIPPLYSNLTAIISVTFKVRFHLIHNNQVNLHQFKPTTKMVENFYRSTILLPTLYTFTAFSPPGVRWEDGYQSYDYVWSTGWDSVHSHFNPLLLCDGSAHNTMLNVLMVCGIDVFELWTQTK